MTRPLPFLACPAAVACGLLLAGCVGSSPREPVAAAGVAAPTLQDQAGAALRADGWRVDRASGGLVRSRPRPVPTLLEPLRRGGGGFPLAAAATLGELREVATVTPGDAGGDAFDVEVWIERAHRPTRRMVIRSDGGVFNDAGFSARGLGDAADPLPGAASGADLDQPVGEAIGLPAGSDGDRVEPTPGGLRWDRWKRNPAAEARLRRALAG